MRSYGFNERLVMSQGAAVDEDIPRLLLKEIPGALAVHPSGTINDKSGTDYWVEVPGGHLSVDVKVRDGQFGPGTKYDDIALETWSVIDKKVGWSRDENKRTDYILCWWQTTRRWCLIPFRLLCRAFAEKWVEWRGAYRVQTQNSGNWKSECVFVPRREIWKAIYLRFGGDQGALSIGDEEAA